MVYDEEHKLLQKGNLRCSEVLRILKKLGFEVRATSNGGHKVFKHSQIREFLGSNFDCGHKPTQTVKPVYIKKIRQIVEQYEAELREFLGENG